MAAFSSPLRLIPPLTPRRAPSPTMSPGGRRGRAHGSSEESRLRDLSPETTLLAFTHRPIPFDTRQDRYHIFSCIETLTAAERDLGARVAKAAQRLKSWCAEIEQWGWSGSFEPPSAAFREQRRRSLELRIREHVPDADLSKTLRPLEYWGSLLSDEVEQHEARLDDIEEEMLKLDVEELKEHVLDMHPAGRSRPSSAGFEAARQNYRLMDDFSFLITQTLLSALPHHGQLKDRLSTWIARVSVLREVPTYLAELDTAQKAMRLGWDAIEPPRDASDLAFAQWKEAVDTISDVLQTKVGGLGRRLDRMLDALEGREDCLPDNWIDVFEGTEADYGRWAHDSRRRVIEFDLRRRVDEADNQRENLTELVEPHSNGIDTSDQRPTSITKPISNSATDPSATNTERRETPTNGAYFPTSTKDVSGPRQSGHLDAATSGARSVLDFKTENPTASSKFPEVAVDRPLQQANWFGRVRDTPERLAYEDANPVGPRPSTVTASTAEVPARSPEVSAVSAVAPTKALEATALNARSLVDLEDTAGVPSYNHAYATRAEPPSVAASTVNVPVISAYAPDSVTSAGARRVGFEVETLLFDDDLVFEEGDTVIHNELDDSPDDIVGSPPTAESSLDDKFEKNLTGTIQTRPKPLTLSDSPVIITTDGQGRIILEPPQTPYSRRGSVGSMSSEMSLESGSPSFVEESPSIRNTTNRAVRVPRPELNAVMAKRRPAKSTTDDSAASPPWPPTRFSQKTTNSAEDLEQKISDILNTIPARIRLTSGPGADAPEVKSTRGVAAKGSRGYLRAARSASGLKSPELTLSPAKNDSDSANAASGRRSAAASRADNDIKLYHLTQPGKEHPIKLFIRRVGENGERVMVRVGGGWADLGEYLRQYAEHHGRRTASEGKFEILGLEVKNPDNSPARPESATSKRNRRFSGGYPTASPTATPSKSSSLGNPKDEASSPMPNHISTPGIAEETSIPSTNSSQRSWQGNVVGLAGPKSKKLDLSGEKLEWIEGMMKQARTVSGNVIPANHTPFQRDERAESRSESRSDSRAGSRAGARKSDFGDLGKVGGTKRIFMRGGQPSTSEH